MTKYVFPYGFSLSLKGGEVKTFPAIELTLTQENSQKEFSFSVLIDSGATISLFTKSDAELLGLVLENGEKLIIEGINESRILAFLHPIIIKVGNEKIKTEIAFADNNNVPRLLGRRHIFSNFFIIFDEKEQKTIFIPRKESNFEKVIFEDN